MTYIISKNAFIVTIYKIRHIFHFLIPFKFYYMILKIVCKPDTKLSDLSHPLHVVKHMTEQITILWGGGGEVLSDSLGLECLTRHTATMLIGFGTNHREQGGRRCFRSSVAVQPLLLRPQPQANSRSG